MFFKKEMCPINIRKGINTFDYGYSALFLAKSEKTRPLYMAQSGD